MAENTQTAKDAAPALTQVFTFLAAKDDTSRFVGLSLLRTILDTNESLRNDEAIIKRCWTAVPNRFLIRLLKSAQTEESRNMNDLAVAVVHTFANLLPTDQVSDKKMFELVEPLANILPQLDAAPQMLAFQALQCVVSNAAGAHVFARATCHGQLSHSLQTDDSRYLREYVELYDLAWVAAHEVELKRFLGKTLMGSMEALEKSSVLVEILGAMVGHLHILDEPRMLELLVKLIQTAITRKPTPQARTAATRLASEVIQRSPPTGQTVTNLFRGPLPSASTEDKPFAYIFTQYVLIDIRSTIPALMTNLASPSYQTDSLRLAACYDVVTGFITYLVSTMDDELTPIPPDLLLKLRRDVSETFSLTLEFFRDRLDAVTTGASGLDPSARTDPKAPAMLTWDNPGTPPEEDPIILSGLRALSLWLREDDNPELNTQALGVADMLAALYESSMRPEAKADFRAPIQVLLEVLLVGEESAVQLFLDNKGWDLLAGDLKQKLESSTGYTSVSGIVRVLLAVLGSDVVPQSREKWMDVVRLAAGLKTEIEDIEVLEGIAEVYQLADAVYNKAPVKLQKLFGKDAEVIAMNASTLAGKLRGTDVDEGLIASFAEVALSLEP